MSSTDRVSAMQEDAGTPDEVDRAWAQWCCDVERFLAWFDGAGIDDDTTIVEQADKVESTAR